MKKERFEDYLAEVEKVVAELEEGEVDLEKSLEKYEAGIKALKKCYEILSGMEKRIEVLTKDADGNLAAKPLKKNS
ncbi:MAG: exodeoxyribonuclease VII small subunit [Planctomycetota bacterium]